MNFHESLVKLGLTPIEATVYITLCEHGSLTGYEVGKITGISRSNVYAALYSLQDKGKCYTASEDTTKYIPISKEELLQRAEDTFKEVLSTIKSHFPESTAVNHPYITIRGFENVYTKIKHTLSGCQSHLYLMTSKAYLEPFSEILETLSTSKRVTIICDEAFKLGDAAILKRNKAPQGFHMIVDTLSVITGDLEESSAQCLYTTNLSLIRLMRESFITELDMIQLKNHSNKIEE